MAFATYYGPGNWELFGIRLPELGITETAYDSQKQSLSDAAARKTTGTEPLQTSVPYMSGSYLVSQPKLPSGTLGTSSVNTVNPASYTPTSRDSVYKQTVNDSGAAVKTYDKGAAAEALGVSRQQLEQMAKDAGYDSTEEFLQNYNPEIENVYREAENYLNRQQERLLAGEQDYYKTYTTPYESQVPLIEQAKQQGVSNLQSQRSAAEMQEQNALSAARRLYNELMSRNQQAFGGGALSSVGQAASEIAAREAQRQFGNIRNTAAQTVQGILTKINDVEAQAQAQLLSLEKEKEAALSQAKLAFKDKLDAIDRDRTQLATAKAQMKYEALLETRARLQAIQDRTTEFAMQIEMMREQARLQAGQYLQNVLGANELYQNQVGQGLQNQALSSQGFLSGMGAANAITGAADNASSNFLLPTGYIGDYTKRLREQAGGD